MERSYKKDNKNAFDKISITKIKLLEFILYVTEIKLEKFMKLEKDLCCVPLKDDNGKILEIKSLKGIAKRLIKKNVFVKSLLRDAWVITRLRVYYLFKLANIHLEKVDLDKYSECIKEAEKEINNRMKTHEDEEAHVFNVLLKIEGLKQHIRNHDLDSLISEYERIKEYVKKIKLTDFGYLLNFRINAGLGYAAKLAQNDIVLPQRFHQAVQIFRFHYEEKRQVTYVDECDHFVYYFSQLQLCKYMQRVDQLSNAMELAEKMMNRLLKKKIKVKVKDHLIQEFQQFLQACISYLQNDQSPRIFDYKKQLKKKKEIVIQSLFDFSQEKEAEEEDNQIEKHQIITKYKVDYQQQGKLSTYLNNFMVKQEDNRQGIFGFYQQNAQRKRSQVAEVQNNQEDQQQKDAIQQQFEQPVKEENREQQFQSDQTKQIGKALINMLAGSNFGMNNQPKNENLNTSQEQSNHHSNHKRVHTEGDKDDKEMKNLKRIFDFGLIKQPYKNKELSQVVTTTEPAETDRMAKLKFFKNSKDAIQTKRMQYLNHHRFSLSINPNNLKNASIDQFIQQTTQSTKNNINSIKNGIIIQDFIGSQKNIQNKRSIDKQIIEQNQVVNRQDSQQSRQEHQQNELQQQYQQFSERIDSQNEVITRISDRFQTEQSEVPMHPMKGFQSGSGEYQYLQNKFSVTIEKEIPYGEESHLDQLKNIFFNQNNQMNNQQDIEQTEQIDQQIQNQNQNTKNKSNEYNFNTIEENPAKAINPYGLNPEIVSQKISINGVHRKSKTFQQFDTISQLLQHYSSKDAIHGKNSSQDNRKILDIPQYVSSQQGMSINTNTTQDFQHQMKRNNSLTKDSTNRNISMPKESIQGNNFMTDNSIPSQSQILTSNSQSQQKLKIKIIPSDVEQFHLAPSFNQRGSFQKNRKYNLSQTNITNNQQSINTQTQASNNVILQNQTKESNMSNQKVFETLNTEQSTLSNNNNNALQILSPTSVNNVISQSGNKVRKISLLSSNKTYTSNYVNQKEAVQEEYQLETDEEQINLQKQNPNFQNKQQQDQNLFKRTNSQSSFEEKALKNLNNIFNNINRRKNNQSYTSLQNNNSNINNQFQSNVKNPTFNSTSDIGQLQQQTQITQQQMTTEETDYQTLSSQRQSLSGYNSGHILLASAQKKKQQINNTQKELLSQKIACFNKNDKYHYLQIYLNKMLHVDNPYDFLPKPSSKEVYQFMKDKFSKTETSQNPIIQIQQQNDEASNDQQIQDQEQYQQMLSGQHVNKNLQIVNNANRRPSSANFAAMSKQATNHQSLDFIYAKQNMQQLQPNQHMKTQTLTTNFETINKINSQRNSINIPHSGRSVASIFSEPKSYQNESRAYLQDEINNQKNQLFQHNPNKKSLQFEQSKIQKFLFYSIKRSQLKPKITFKNEDSEESIRSQIKQAKLEIQQQNSNENYSKQTTLFSLDSLKSDDSQTSQRGFKSRFANQATPKPSTFKNTLITKNSFDSDNSDDNIQPISLHAPTRNLLRRSKAIESLEDDEEEVGSQQQPVQQRHSALSPNSTNQLKSINSIAFMLVGKKNWYNVQNKDMLLSNRSTISNLARDQLSLTILQLNLKFPVFCFCTHRIGRFQNWKVRYVDYYQQNKCFQLNFLGLDNLFYKMFIPVKTYKTFNFDQGKFVTIWPIVLDYLMDYMQSKKIILKFTDDSNQDKKHVIKDLGLSKYLKENIQQSEVAKLAAEVINYKNYQPNTERNESQESLESFKSDEDSDEGSDVDENGVKKKKKKCKYKFFLGLARKNSYFPTIRDGKAAAKIKKIFEILLYRYMYDQLRPTGKKLILKKDASIQKYKTLSKKIQKLENDLEKTTMKQQIKQGVTSNTVDNLLSKKFGTFQLRKLVQKDLMKIPDKQEYQIEQIWRLRYRENAYQLSSFIFKTKEKYYYLVSLSVAFKKDHNALLQMFLKKNDSNKGLKDQFEKIIQVQLLRKPKQEKNMEDQIKEQQQREQKILQMIEQQQMNESTPHQQRTAAKRNSLTKLSTYGSQSRLQSSHNIIVTNAQESKQKMKNQKIFQEEDFKEIFRNFDLNQILRSIVYTQKIPKIFKLLCIKNLKRRVIITDEQLFLRLDKIDIISRKINQPPPILVQTEVPDATDLRMRDFLTKQNPFISTFNLAYQKSEFRQEKTNAKHHNFDQDSELSDDNEPDFNGYFGNNVQIKEVQEDFEKIEKAEKANNYYFEELHFKCSCNMKQSNNSIYLKYFNNNTVFYLKVTMHGQDHTESDHLTENIHAHLDITVISPMLRFRKTYSTNKRKALLLFNSFKKIKYKNAFDPPIFLTTRKRIELDFETNIQRVSRRKTIGEIMQRTEVSINNLSELPSIEILKISLLKNSSQMENLRSFKRYSVVDQISSFGKVVVTMTIFYDHVSGKLYTLEFQDFTSKSRMYRIALNDNDLADLFGLRLFSDDSADTIIKIIRRICYHVRFEQQNFYRVPFLYFREEQYRNGLQLDQRNIIEKLRKNEFYSNYRRFYNKIVKYTFEKENLHKNKRLYLIDAQRKQSRIIFHKAFVHQNEYFIMTINKSLVLQEFWMLSIYVPKTGRRIMGYMQSRDIEQIQFQNLTKDMGLFELYDRDQPFKSYLDFIVGLQNVVVKQSPRTNQRAKNSFLRAYSKKFSHKLKGQNSINLDKSNNDEYTVPNSPDYIKSSQQKSGDHLDLPSEDEPVKPIISPRITPRMMVDHPKVIIPQKVIKRHEKRYGTHINFNANHEEQTDTQMRIVLEEKFHQITAQISKAYKQSYILSYRLSNLSQFVEMKIWEDITSKMILKHKGTAYCMQMGNISVPMQEFINSSQIQTDQGPEIFVEYFIGKQNNSGEYSVTQNFEEISYPASLLYYIYLRFYHFNQVGIMHKKINLRELLNLFIADGYYKYQTNYMHSKLQLQDLVQLCDFVSYKLRTGTYGSILNQNQFQFKRTGLESYSRKTLQTLVKEQEQEEGENGIVEKFVFQTKPYSIVKIFIKRANRIVEFLIYTPSTSQTFKKKYTMSEISLSIPFVNLYLKSGLFRPLAKNILKLLHKELSFHLKNLSKEKQTKQV